LLIIAKIKSIIKKDKENIDNNSSLIQNLKEDDTIYIIQIDTPEYIIGFEDDNLAIKNYI